MKGENLLSALGGIDDELIAAAGRRLGCLRASSSPETEEVSMDTKKAKRFSKTTLIAAVIAAAMAITALATYYATTVHRTDGLSGTWGGNQRVYFEDARTYVTFESSAPRHEYLFKANWLPSPPSWGEAGEFTDYLADEGHGALLPYEINSYNRTDLQGIRYCFDGEAEVVRQDMWNGFERTELVIDYTGTHHSYTKAGYVLLFQPEDNYLVFIGGTSPIEMLEKIAENLEIQLGPVIETLYDSGSDIAMLDIGRG